MPKSDIVFGSEFSPAVIDLPKLLRLVVKHQPNRAALQAAIDKEFFPGKGRNADPRKTLGDNAILSMIAYEVLHRSDEDHNCVNLTALGKDLHKHRNSLPYLKNQMGKHCLINLKGMRLVTAIRSMTDAQVQLKKTEIAKHLRREGLHVPANGKHLNVLRQWLEFAGILNPAHLKSGEAMWTPDDARINELMGVTVEDLDQWDDLTPEQRDFAKAFALMGVDEAASSEVRQTATDLYGTEFPEGGLPKSVLHRLAEVGLICWEKTTRGRGAKAHVVYTTEKLKTEYLGPLLEQIASVMGPGYRRLSRMSLAEIIQSLGSANKHEKGIALEALAFYFCQRLDLEFVQWRARSNATGGAEVDMIVEGCRLLFSRWQIQCKNTARVATEDLAKEVGIATALRSQVIMLVSTGTIGAAVRKFAKTVMENTAFHIILLSKKELAVLIEKPTILTTILNGQARDAMTMKRSQVQD